MALIRKDSHGLYITTGGTISRPQRAKGHDFDMPPLPGLEAGMTVGAKGCAGGYVQLSYKKKVAFWFIHKAGPNIATIDGDSEPHWNPAEDVPTNPYTMEPMKPGDKNVFEEAGPPREKTLDDTKLPPDPRTLRQPLKAGPHVCLVHPKEPEDSPELAAAIAAMTPREANRLGGFKVKMTIDISIDIVED